ncbi:hypothetical protein [Nocardioides marmoraquaticus]
MPTGIYWHRSAWDRARSAYVADLDADPDPPVSLIAWLQRAIAAHAELTPAARAAVLARSVAERGPTAGEAVGAEASRGGFKRTLLLDAAVLRALESAVLEDRSTLGRVVSRSEFVREAASVAATEAEARLGRELPPPPSRLPNRPVLRTKPSEVR